MRKFLAVLCGLAALLNPAARGQVYQFALATRNVDEKEITAFLWVPAAADRLRGVLIGGQTLMEQAFAGDPLIRQVCAEEKLAIVYFAPHLDAVFDYVKHGAGERLEETLQALGELSGYRELAVAPLFPYGHSVSSIFASHVICWRPGRCFGALAFKGGLMRPADDPAASLAGVPILVIKGQFEEFGPGPSGVLRADETRETAWRGMAEIVRKLRAEDERNLISYLVEEGATHFAWSERLARSTAEFIRSAARQRIPEWPVETTEPVACREVALALPPDELPSDLPNKEPQFVSFADPKTGRAWPLGSDLRMRLQPEWIGSDTFRVAGLFLEQPGVKYPAAAGPVSHAEGAIRFRAFAGPLRQVGRDTFQVCPDGRPPMRPNVLAYHPGDDRFRHAEQAARVNLPERLTAGRPQRITFAPASLDAALNATSDAGLPVHFAVSSGPAVIEGSMLKITEVPARFRRPIAIEVVACQYGSAVPPLVQSAELVRQTLWLSPP